MMMRQTFFRTCALAACVSLAGEAASASVSFEGARPSQDNAKQEQGKENKGPKLSDAERKLAVKINEATDPAAKLQAAIEFVKKFPKSEARRQAVEVAAGQVANTTDPAQRITLAESYLAAFTEPGEADLIAYSLLDAYLDRERVEDAFRVGAQWLQKNPEDVDVLRRLAITAGNAAVKGNNAYIAQGRQYAQKSIELIEADKKPAVTDDAKWAEYKAHWLPALHREAGVLAMRAGDRAATRTSMEKAATLKSSDPIVYLVLSEMANEEYNNMAKQYQAMPAGAEKTAQLKKVEEQLDRVIELFAQVLAVAEGNAQYAEASKQIRQDLEGYYKYRHNGSTAGLQQLIDKYKKPASQ